jgi:hypothetical protein
MSELGKELEECFTDNGLHSLVPHASVIASFVEESAWLSDIKETYIDMGVYDNAKWGDADYYR